jgi:tetratricopeptide (TPR) repeat protein
MRFSARWIGFSLVVLSCSCAAVGAAEDEMLAAGRRQWEKNEYDAACQTFTKVTEIDGSCAEAYYGRGMARAANGKYEAAIEDFSQAIRCGYRGRAYLNRGRSLLAKGDTDLAITDLTEAIRRTPGDAQAFTYRSMAYGSKGDYPRAIADATRAIELDRHCTQAYGLRARAYGMLNKLDEAISDCNRAIELVVCPIQLY